MSSRRRTWSGWRVHDAITDVARHPGRPGRARRRRLADRHHRRARRRPRARWRASTYAVAGPAPARPTCSTRATWSSGSTPWCSAAAPPSGWRPSTGWCSGCCDDGDRLPGGRPRRGRADRARRGDLRPRPGRELRPPPGRRARARRRTTRPSRDVAEGNHGAGAGARAGGLKGGVGTASATLPDGTDGRRTGRGERRRVVRRPATGELWAARHCRPRRPARPAPAGRGRAARGQGQAAARDRAAPAAAGDHAGRDRHRRHADQGPVRQGQRDRPRRAGPRDQPGAHDVRRRHRLHAGHLRPRGRPDPSYFHALLETAGDCVTRAVARAMLAAESPTGCGATGTRSRRPSAEACTRLPHRDIPGKAWLGDRHDRTGARTAAPPRRRAPAPACGWRPRTPRRVTLEGRRAPRDESPHVPRARPPLRAGLRRGARAGQPRRRTRWSVDGEQVWPEPDSPFPPSADRDDRPRTSRSGWPSAPAAPRSPTTRRATSCTAWTRCGPTRCGWPASPTPPHDDDPDPGDQARWPDLVLFLGDQVYADETTDEMQAFIESRRRHRGAARDRAEGLGGVRPPLQAGVVRPREPVAALDAADAR